jgi:hypothetical protein
MPNHIINILTIEGPEDLVAKIKSEISGFTEEEGVEMPIDFYKFFPLPKDLEGTTSPTRIISQEEYDAQEARISSGQLDPHEISFGVSRGITQKMSNEFILMYGSDNWYDWRINAWGTKWNAYSQEVRENGDIKFETAWSTPYKVISMLSSKYPDAKFKMRYADEDFGYNVGEYTFIGGVDFNENYPEGGSEEAYMMACDIRDEWELIPVRIEEMEQEELGDKWAQMYLKIAYNKELFGDYQKFVWDYLEKTAVEEENYEFAKKIKDHLDKIKSEECFSQIQIKC